MLYSNQNMLERPWPCCNSLYIKELKIVNHKRVNFWQKEFILPFEISILQGTVVESIANSNQIFYLGIKSN